MRGVLTIFLSLLLLAFMGCEKKNSLLHPVSCDTEHKLEGTWRLDAYQNLNDGTLEPDPKPEDRGVVLTFTDDSNSIGFQGYTPVNTVGGGYRKAGSCTLEDGSFGEVKWVNRRSGTTRCGQLWVVSKLMASQRKIFTSILMGSRK